MDPNLSLISFDLKAEMGFFKKPDINNGIYLTYNMLHKPALMGILGAIIGLEGYGENGKIPEYYVKLHHIPVGIEPVNSSKGNFSKEIISYNNSTGFANISGDKAGANLIVTEQVILNPCYRCYLLLNLDDQLERELHDYLRDGYAEYIPYMGKNEFGAWWFNYKEESIRPFTFDRDFSIRTLFVKNAAVRPEIAKQPFPSSKVKQEPPFFYFERLPVALDTKFFQYSYCDFAYSNATFHSGSRIQDCGKFFALDDGLIIQFI